MSSAGGRLLVHSAKQVVQVVNNGEKKLVGEAMRHPAILNQPEQCDGYSVVCDHTGRIVDVGTDTEINTKYDRSTFDTVINASGKSILPGLVDGHTHAVWVGDRVHEFGMKLAGATYMEVHAAGGGINYTVEKVRQATQQHLYQAFCNTANKMVQAGTTLAEVKSGYGLDLDTEMKMLRVIEQGRRDPHLHLDVSSTYCGGHAVPKGSDAEAATLDIVHNQIPALRTAMQAGELTVDNIDVFCETGVYNVQQTRAILEAGKEAGMQINFHGEELSCLNSAEMGAELGSLAISHLEEVSDEGIKAMAAAGTSGVILPTTAYQLRLTPPPVRKMIDQGVIIALGSDFNPNAHCLSMPLVMNLACVICRMSMEEALVAATINAAYSLGRSTDHGSIEPGKIADLVIVNEPSWQHLVYQLGGHHDVIDYVIKDGRIVVDNTDRK